MSSADTAAPEVVTCGEAMILMLAAEDRPLAHAGRYDAMIAGAESNVAIGLARLGHRVAFFGKVGDDVFGEQVRRDLRAEGVDVTHLSSDPDRPTGLLFRDTVVGSPITVHYCRAGSAATAMSVADVPRGLVEQARLLHVTGITAALSEVAFEATLETIRLARASGVHVSLDPNLRLRLASRERWQVLIDALARECDVVLTGVEEAEVFTGGADPVGWLRDRGVGTVVIKRGAEGATEDDLRSGERVAAQPARAVPLVDPVGAGDAFDAGWLSGWLRGLPATDRLREAAAVASLVVASRGDSAGLPSAALRDRVLAEGSDVER
ncbi:MAG TPA: sugar kinase [Propionibacteriaceae bacterium]